VKSLEKEKSEFIESHMAERRNEVAQLKEHHRSLETFQFLLIFTRLYFVNRIIDVLNVDLTKCLCTA